MSCMNNKQLLSLVQPWHTDCPTQLKWTNFSFWSFALIKIKCNVQFVTSYLYLRNWNRIRDFVPLFSIFFLFKICFSNEVPKMFLKFKLQLRFYAFLWLFRYVYISELNFLLRKFIWLNDWRKLNGTFTRFYKNLYFYLN